MVNNILDALFPNACLLCGLHSARDVPLCASCQGSLALNRHQCSDCALPLPPTLCTKPGCKLQCGQCQSATPPWRRVIIPWLYDEQMAYLIRRWKFHGERRLSPLLARLWLEGCDSIPQVDAIVPVPLHWWRLCRRGFNQSHLLAQQLQRQCPALHCVPLHHRTIRRTRATYSQANLTVNSRRDNLEDAFEVIRPCAQLRIAVVDDVMTTGSTAAAITNTLLRAGATSVDLWCLARTPAPAN